MIRRIMALAGLALTVAAAALALAVPASARSEAQVHLVSGNALGGQLSGGLDGTVSETPDSFASFLATVRLTPGGILTWRWSQTFDGCIDGHCGRLFLEGHFLYRFKPGTKVYDFAGPRYQPGTTGDPDALAERRKRHPHHRRRGRPDGRVGDPALQGDDLPHRARLRRRSSGSDAACTCRESHALPGTCVLSRRRSECRR